MVDASDVRLLRYARPTGSLVTPAANDYPRLPVRSGESVFTWLARHADADAAARADERLARSQPWNEVVLPRLLAASAAPMQEWRLRPTARSLLR